MLRKAYLDFSLKKMFFLFVIIYLLFLILYSVSGYRDVIENAKKNSLKAATISSLQVHSVFQQVSNILLIIDGETSRTQMTPQEISNYLSIINILIPDIETIKSVDQDGVIFSSSNDIYLGHKSLENYQTIRESSMKNNQFITRETEKSLISKEEMISFNYRRSDRSKKFIGVIKADIPFRLWYDNFKPLIENPNDEINIINLGNCELLGSSSYKNEKFESSYIDSEFCKLNLTKNSKEYQYSEIDPKTGNAISYVVSPIYHLATVSIISKKSYFAPFLQEMLIILIISVAVMLAGWLLVKHQIATEEKLNDERALLNHASKMASLGEMASGIAHEINNPLGVAVGMLQLAMKYLKKLNNPELASLEKNMATTLFSLERITKIVHGMKVISRHAESDAHELVSLNEIFTNSTIFYQEKLKKHNTDLKIDLIPEIELLCNETQISQLVINLIGNSSDAIEHLEVRWIHVSFEVIEKDKKFKIFFTDSGNGIPKEVLDKLMQPFFTTKPAGKGTGLGLTIVNKIVQEHKGKFEYNKDSSNTQFVVTLNYEAIKNDI